MKLSDQININLPYLLNLRRHLHSHPELSGVEYQTAALIAGELRNLGWFVKEGVGKTGVVAEIGPNEGPLVGLRVDMDALPIEEFTELPYASKSQGLMHACGHDIHTSIGIGVAQILSKELSKSDRVRILFQPAEELAVGAAWMRDAGATKGLDALFGVHVVPDIPVGKVGLRSGCLTAAAGELQINFSGEGGHGARPHLSTDTIWMASKVVTELQQAISRRLDALSPVVISFGRISGGRLLTLLLIEFNYLVLCVVLT